MSQFPAEPAWVSKARRFDQEAVKPARAAAANAVDQREEKRLSIAEMNELDADDIYARMARRKFDTRGPVIKFLDLVDVPRNTIAGLLASGTRRAKEAEGETAAFGRGRVMFSDLLGEMGMRPGLARGVVGFVGDVAMDPLTYLGGAGVAKTVAARGGRVVAGIGRQGTRALRKGVSSVAAGAPIKAPEVAAIYQASVAPKVAQRTARAARIGATDPEAAARLMAGTTPKAQASLLSRAGGRRYEPLKDTLIEGAGFARRGEGGLVARAATARLPDAAEEAATLAGAKSNFQKLMYQRRVGELKAGRGYLERYARGAPVSADQIAKGGVSMTPKGLALGDAQSQILHIPFTEYGVWTPAVFSSGKAARAERLRFLARGGDAAAVGSLVNAGANADFAGRVHTQIGNLIEQDEAIANELRVAPDRVDLQEQLAAVRQQRSDLIDQVRSANVAHVKAMSQAPLPPSLTVGDLEDIDRMGRAAQAIANGLEAEAKAEPFYELFETQRRAGQRFSAAPLISARNKLEEAVNTVARGRVAETPEGQRLLGRAALLNDIKKNPNDYLFHGTPGESAAAAIESDGLRAGGLAGGHGDVADYAESPEGYVAVFRRADIPENPGGYGDVSFVPGYQPAKPIAVFKQGDFGDPIGYGNRMQELGDGPQPENFERLEYGAVTKAEIEAHTARIAAQVREQRADSMIDGLLNVDDDELLRRADLSQALHEKWKAAHDWAQAARGTLTAVTTQRDRLLSDVAKTLLQIHPEAIDGGMFTSVRQALAPFATNDGTVSGMARRTMFDALESVSRGGRAAFGNRGTRIDNARRLMEHTLQGGDRAMAQTVLRPGFVKLAKIRSDYGLAPDKLDALTQLVMLRMYQKVLGSNQDRFFLRKIVNGKDAGPSKMAELMDSARDAGWLDPKFDQGRYANLLTDVDALADEWVGMIDRLGDAGEAGNTLGKRLPGYMPLVLDPRTQAKVVRRGGGKGQAVATTAVEGFQRARQTQKYVWRDDAGKYHQLLDWHFEVPAKYQNPEALATLANNPEQLKQVAGIIDEVKAFHKQFEGVDDGLRRGLMAYNLDPWEAAELAKEGVFDALFGTSAGSLRELFTTNALHMMTQRVASHFSGQAKASFNALRRQYALPLADTVHATQSEGETVYRMANGVPVRPMGGGRVLIGDTVYRQINPEAMKSARTGNLLFEGVEDGRNLTGYFPETVAETIERMIDAGSPANQSKVLEAIASFQQAWKGFTLLHPSWTVWNLTSLPILALQGRIPLDGVIRHARDAMRVRLSMDRPDRLAGRSVNLGGQQTSLEEIALGYQMHGSGATYGDEWLSMTPDQQRLRYSGELTGQSVKDRMAGTAAGLKQRWDDQLAADTVGRAAGPADKVMAGAKVFKDERYMRRFFNGWAKANAALEDSFRVAAFMALMDSGESAASAGARVRSAFYDYADATKAELHVKRYWFPFLAWTRNNTGYQVARFLEDPKWVAAYPKLKEALEESIAGDQQVPDRMRPTWMREQLAVQLAGDPSARTAVTVGTVSPTEPVNVLGGALTGADGATKAASWLASQIGPHISVPLQLAARREFFTDRKIGPNEGEGDISARDFIANQIRPVRELGLVGVRKSPLMGAFGRGTGEGITRAALGGRAQPFDDERMRFHLVREFKEREDGLRRFIAIAQREGDEERSKEGRARLMLLFADALEKGLEQEVPVWARKQLRGALTG